MKKFLVGVLLFVSVALSCIGSEVAFEKNTQARASAADLSWLSPLKLSMNYYFNLITPDANSVLGRIAAPFQAGYKYTDEQKAVARKRIDELYKEREHIATLKVLPDKAKRLQEIDDEIYEQKLITGEMWSKERKVVLGTIALLGAAAISFKLYKNIDLLVQNFKIDSLMNQERKLRNEVIDLYFETQGGQERYASYDNFKQVLDSYETVKQSIGTFYSGKTINSFDLIERLNDKMRKQHEYHKGMFRWPFNSEEEEDRVKEQFKAGLEFFWKGNSF